MSVYGSIFYFVALALGGLYAFLLIFCPRFTLRPPDEVWASQEKWVKQIGFFYAAPILGLVMNGLILYFVIDQKIVKLAVGLCVAVTIGLSLVVDAKWKSKPGIAIDLGILIAITVSFLLS